MKNVRGDGHLLGILLIDPLRQQNGVDIGIQNSLMIGSLSSIQRNINTL